MENVYKHTSWKDSENGLFYENISLLLNQIAPPDAGTLQAGSFLLHPKCNNQHSQVSETIKTPFTRAKKFGTASQIFGTASRLPVPRLPPGCSPGTFKITFGTDTVTRRKLGVPCLKIVITVPKIWRAVPTFLARVNGVSGTGIFHFLA